MPASFAAASRALRGIYLVFGEAPGRDTLAGAAVVAAAGLYNLRRERVRRAGAGR